MMKIFMKLSYLLLPPIFLIVSIYAQDSVSPVQSTEKEVHRNFLSKIESAVNDRHYELIESWSKDPAVIATLTKQDLKPLLDKCASQVKWYAKKYRFGIVFSPLNLLTLPISASPLTLGMAMKKTDPAKNKSLFTYIAIKKLYNSLPAEKSHHRIHKHRKR